MDNDKYRNKYRIPSARAVWHDYNGGIYFITICTAKRKFYFGRIESKRMILNALGQKLNDLIMNIPIHHPYAEITAYQIMPNHVHLIVCIDETLKTNNVPDFWGVDGRDANGVDDGRDVACRVSTGKPTNPPIKNEKMQAIADHCGLLSTTIGGIKSAMTRFANDNKMEF